MKRLIEVKVDGSHLTKNHNLAGVQHEANMTSLRITFDESWDGLAKTVTWWDAKGRNPVKRVLTADLLEDVTQSTRRYLCSIPGEPLVEAGMCTFVIDGYVDGKRQRSISDQLKVTAAAFAADAAEPTDPTPTQAEQLQVQMESVLTKIQKAVDVAAAADEAKATADAALLAADRAEELLKTGTHAARHAVGGDDPIYPVTIGAVPQLNQVPNGQDLNTVTESGFYRLNVTHGHMPAECGYGQLLVIHGGNDTIVQLCVAFDNTVYSRAGNPPDVGGVGGWTSWRQLAFWDTVVKKAGDTMTGRLQVPTLTITDYSAPFEGPQYIDFHAIGVNQDYNGRLTVDASNTLYYSKYGEPNNRVIHEGMITKSTVDIGAGAAMATGTWYAVYE